MIIINYFLLTMFRAVIPQKKRRRSGRLWRQVAIA
jgi:hypothetical protein